MRAQLVTLGPHAGSIRDLARGVRLAARPYVDRWGRDYLEPADALRRASELLPRPERADAVTWVPGHDGSPGPGHALAAALATSWRLPLRECLLRPHEIPSAHSSGERPGLDSVCDSLAVTGRHPGRLVVVDNVIASGANMLGALRTLAAAGRTDLIVMSVSIDATAGSGAHLVPQGGGWAATRRLSCRRRAEPPR
ncbi:hypothetical protein [Nocardioides sp. L-11A]|uniref:hypothetical protein n=1 Tax=Nocardioides sp. L-11A TaxID=3043848 RepID=UPI00249ABE66|nr:hypothetical protein QJ852_06860 [Nocardioides sp. L-11A]